MQQSEETNSPSQVQPPTSKKKKAPYLIKLLNYLLLVSWGKQLEVRLNDGLCESLHCFLSVLIAHQSMPHYPLVVDSVAINDIIKCSFMRRVECHLSGETLPCFRHNVGQCSTLQVLHDDPQLLLHQGRLKHLHHVPVLIVPHDDNLQPRTRMWEPWEELASAILFMSSNIKGLLSNLALP